MENVMSAQRQRLQCDQLPQLQLGSNYWWFINCLSSTGCILPWCEATCKACALRHIAADLWPLIWCGQLWFVIGSRSIVMSFSNKQNVPGSGSRRKLKLKQQLITALRQQDQHHLEALQRDATVVKGCLRRVTISAACPNPCFCAPHIYLIQFAYIAKGQYWCKWYAKLVSSGELPGRVFQSNEWWGCFLLAGKNPKLFKPDFQSAAKKKPTCFFVFYTVQFP